MSWMSSMLSGGVDKIVDSVGSAVDSLVTSDEERLVLKNKLQEIKNEAILSNKKLEVEFDKEITKRWTSDNEHTITRLVRPVSFISVLTLFGFMVLFDGNLGNRFIVHEAYIPVIQMLLLTMVGAYFGGRSIEKIAKSKMK